MASQALYTKYRPYSFDEVSGQSHVTYTLRSALISGRIGHAYLFAGPRGTGKTTMARVLAKAVNCLAEQAQDRPCNQCAYCVAVNEGRFLDLIEIDAASHTGVDDVRELRDRIAFSPNEGRYKIYIIDEVHRFSGAAFDALLKTIEEPPPHAIFILATTEIHKVPQTILSRCQRFDFKRIPVGEIVERLQQLAEGEGVEVEQAALELIARQATGSLRDAISLLDQLISEPGQALTVDVAREILGTVASDTVRDLTAALIAGDTALGLDLINQTLDDGADPRQFAGQMVEYLRLIMLVQTGGPALVEMSAGPDEIAAVREQAGLFPRGALLQAMRRFNRAATESAGGWQPQLPLELAFVESVEALYAGSDAAAQASQAAQPVQPSQRPAGAPTGSPAARPARAAAAQGDELNVEDISKRWTDVRRILRTMDMEADALLNSSKGMSVEENTLILHMPSDLLRDKIEREHTRTVIEQTLNQVFGQRLKVRARVVGASNNPESNDDDLLAEDSLASYLVNELGGKVKKRGKSTEEKAE
jgi:DNA polymerase-3 subunit gamma/tau